MSTKHVKKPSSSRQFSLLAASAADNATTGGLHRAHRLHRARNMKALVARERQTEMQAAAEAADANAFEYAEECETVLQLIKAKRGIGFLYKAIVGLASQPHAATADLAAAVAAADDATAPQRRRLPPSAVTAGRRHRCGRH